MFKKLGISLLAFTILATIFNKGIITTVYATPAPCGSIAECREAQEDARTNIAQMLEEAEELGDDIAEIQTRITELRGEVAELETEVAGLEAEIASLTSSMEILAEEIEENIEFLQETEEQIEILIDEIAQRMRITQRVNNQNSILTILSEAESLVDFMRRARTFSQMATEDAMLMDELSDLVEVQEVLLIELDEQADAFYENREAFTETRVLLEQEQSRLTAVQLELINNEAQMQDRLYRLNEDRHDEEALLAALEEAEEILRRTPPPPVVTNNNSNSSSSGSGSTSQTPNASGLAHPMPGAHVTDEFGSRGGGHRGIDLVVAGNPSAPILAAADGTVTFNGWETGFGFYIIISHMINGQRVDTLYAHLRYASPVAQGTVVSQGDVVGTKGNTGVSFGAHLHFEVHPGGISWGPTRGVNPRNWISF